MFFNSSPSDKKKYHFLLLLLLVYSCLTYSQNIVSINFEDTFDPDIGNGCAIDKRNFALFINRLHLSLGYPVSEYNYSENNFQITNFEHVADNIKTTDNDIVVAYISSHGGRYNDDRSKFPRILFGDNISTGLKSIEDFFNTMVSKPHKTLLVVVDACNNDIGMLTPEQISPKETKTFAKSYYPSIPKEISSNEKAIVKKMFVEDCFEVLVTSSEPPITSITEWTGSLFTNNFISSMYYHFTQQLDVASIDNVLTKAYAQTYYESQRLYINDKVKISRDASHQPYHPYWEKPIIHKCNAYVVKDLSSEDFEINYTVSNPSWLERLFRGGANKYDVHVTIATKDKDLFQRIDTVKYYLDVQTFANPEVKVWNPIGNFYYNLNIYDEFLLRAEVVLKNGKAIDLAKNLKIK